MLAFKVFWQTIFKKIMQDTMRVFFGVAPFLPLQPSDNPYSDKMRKARCKDNDFSCRADVLDDIKVQKNPGTCILA